MYLYRQNQGDGGGGKGEGRGRKPSEGGVVTRSVMEFPLVSNKDKFHTTFVMV